MLFLATVAFLLAKIVCAVARLNEWMDGQKGLIDGLTDESRNDQRDGLKDEGTDRWMDRQKD